MEKMMLMRSLCRSIIRRSQHFSSAGAAVNCRIRHLHFSPPSLPASSRNRHVMHPFAMCPGNTRFFSEDVTHMPVIKDQEIERAFKDLMATNWDELSPAIVYDVKNALSKNTEDKAAQDVLKNVFRAAEAVEEFTGVIMSLKMELDDVIGLSGENVKPLTEEYSKALQTIFDRYAVYLAAFGPEETYLKKKVETELGTKMIYLKMRCGGLDAEWGKVTVLATSGLSGSYVEKRA
ncbi:Succinate dehydrogenase subunit 5- mitochondrial [Striga hermonthica]|uniref:Succinate dehydrogenase subunit 5- mitochondrial n=1 Tax=Striga hermonthica TaxID=68872 RepID=A0A9N7NDA5_STRHE|nr:Succinate dehydrogenase subunit 5- mitochondrial [Striga hermonthica]